MWPESGEEDVLLLSAENFIEEDFEKEYKEYQLLHHRENIFIAAQLNNRVL